MQGSRNCRHSSHTFTHIFDSFLPEESCSSEIFMLYSSPRGRLCQPSHHCSLHLFLANNPITEQTMTVLLWKLHGWHLEVWERCRERCYQCRKFQCSWNSVALHKETTRVLDLILMSSAILLRAFHKCVAEIATTVLMPGKRHVTFFGWLENSTYYMLFQSFPGILQFLWKVNGFFHLELQC